MIGQYLSNKNESATVSKSKKFLDLNKPLHVLRLCEIYQLFIYSVTTLFYFFLAMLDLASQIANHWRMPLPIY